MMRFLFITGRLLVFGGLLLFIALAAPAFSCPEPLRSREVPRQFMLHHPCPANGATHGACPGWVRDHIIPLCAGGSDTVANMQWQTVADAKAKDILERRECGR
jgi:hypothetical protein